MGSGILLPDGQASLMLTPQQGVKTSLNSCPSDSFLVMQGSANWQTLALLGSANWLALKKSDRAAIKL
jgi:hypothetical protein